MEGEEEFLARCADIESRMAFGNKDILFLRRAEFERLLAIAAGSRRAKTPQAVECVASQSGPSGIAQKDFP
jgi:hypothetical protein